MKKKQSASNKNERQVLKKFLTRYYKAKKQQGILQERLIRMQSEFGNSIKHSEIEAKIKAQKQQAQKSIHQIMEILDLLPQGSTERTIMELRHIDCKTWTQIQRAVCLTSSPCYERYNKGLDTLLTKSRVRDLTGLSNKIREG